MHASPSNFDELWQFGIRLMLLREQINGLLYLLGFLRFQLSPAVPVLKNSTPQILDVNRRQSPLLLSNLTNLTFAGGHK